MRRLSLRLRQPSPNLSVLRSTRSYRDVFLCHAHEDRVKIVAPLYAALIADGISCWLDEAEINWGDSITQKVSEGLRTSRYIVAILSPCFLRKKWPRRELNAILNLEAATGVVRVLALISGCEHEKRRILEDFVLLNDKMYVEWAGSPKPVVAALKAKLAACA